MSENGEGYKYKEFHTQYLKDQSSVREKWNLKMTELHQLKMDLMGDSSSSTIIKDKPELVTLNDSYNLLKENMDISEVLEIFIKPMSKYFSNLYEQDHTNQTVNLLLSHFQKMEIIYAESTAFINRYKTYLSSVIDGLEADFIKLELTKYSS